MINVALEYIPQIIKDLGIKRKINIYFGLKVGSSEKIWKGDYLFGTIDEKGNILKNK